MHGHESEVKKVTLHHSRKLSLTHLEADPLESGPAMEQCQMQLLPIVVITAITADANVNSSLICMEKLHGRGVSSNNHGKMGKHNSKLGPVPMLHIQSTQTQPLTQSHRFEHRRSKRPAHTNV